VRGLSVTLSVAVSVYAATPAFAPAAGTSEAAPRPTFDAAAWRRVFARPDTVPTPPGNPSRPEKIELGRRLFNDIRLSGSNEVACASCHQADLAFSDGVARRQGLLGDALARRTPALWNLAWGITFFWDGRASSLEDQVHFPVENRHEMGGDLAQSAAELSRDEAMRKAFAAAFPEEPSVTPDTIAKAIAAYERTLVSPPTRFDAWVAGDDNALTADEQAGLQLFVGKAGCVACHTGWRFTDDAFHDIGLRSERADRGRGAVIELEAANRAFKTPSLRERVWTAPYMHDGSLASLDEVIDHYVAGVEVRPTLSADLRTALDLSGEERAQLLAFLATLSSDDPPRPEATPPRSQVIGPAGAGDAVPARLVGQRGKQFRPGAVSLRAGETLTIVNDDTRTHNVRMDAPGFQFSSDAQAPGDSVTIAFPTPGEFGVICGIHPQMRLHVRVD
jgi:cytochrome c peroxidase